MKRTISYRKITSMSLPEMKETIEVMKKSLERLEMVYETRSGVITC